MAQWQRTLAIKDEWQAAQNGEITQQKLAGVIADRLNVIGSYANEYVENLRQELVEQFLGFSEDETADVRDFDYLMSDLYDWADMKLDDQWNGKKVCWIATF